MPDRVCHIFRTKARNFAYRQPRSDISASRPTEFDRKRPGGRNGLTRVAAFDESRQRRAAAARNPPWRDCSRTDMDREGSRTGRRRGRQTWPTCPARLQLDGREDHATAKAMYISGSTGSRYRSSTAPPSAVTASTCATASVAATRQERVLKILVRRQAASTASQPSQWKFSRNR